MKHIYFKRKDSVFRSLQEEKKVVKYKRFNWDRIIYFILLFTILFIVGRYAFMKLYYIKAEGQILFKNLNVQNLEDCRILKFNVIEGSNVHKGDTLFYYTTEDNAEFGANTFHKEEMKVSEKSNWSEKEEIEIKEELEYVAQELKESVKTRQKLSAELQQISQEVLLEVVPKSVYYQKESEISKLDSNIELLKQKSGILKSKLIEVKQLKNSKGSKVLNVSERNHRNLDRAKPFISPMEGVVTKIFKENQEVALKSEIVMFLQKSENVYIKVFFEQKDIEDLTHKNVVEIEFPDGLVSYGKISRFYFSTYRIPEEFQKKYEPTTRSLSVDIVPLNQAEFQKWHKYYKLSVIIRKVRF